MARFLAIEGLLDNGLKFRLMTLPDRVIHHDKPAAQYTAAGLTTPHIVALALAAHGRVDEAATPALA